MDYNRKMAMDTMNNNHVSIFIPSLEGGGAERAMVMVANGLADRGYDVDLVMAQAKGPYLNEVNPKVKIVDFQVSRIMKCLPKFIRYLRKEQPTVMLSAMYYANIVSVLARMLSGVSMRLVVSERTNYYYSKSHMHSYWGRLISEMVPWAYSRSDAIIAVSQGVANDLIHKMKLPPEKVCVIYNPIDLSQIENLKKQNLDHDWFRKGQPPVIISVGRLTEAKDYYTLIRAFSLVRQKQMARLVILGEGELRQQLEQFAFRSGYGQDIDFPGFQANPFPYIFAAKVFVLSSKWEGLPNVLLQAMACGTPVVATDCSFGPSEILENGRWGKLVPVGNAEELANAILNTMNATVHPEMQLRIQDFQYEKIIEQYIRVLCLK